MGAIRILWLAMFVFFNSFFKFTIGAQERILVKLMALEMMSIALFLGLLCIFNKDPLAIYNVIFFLIITVQESVVGLSLLVSAASTHGVDQVKSINACA